MAITITWADVVNLPAAELASVPTAAQDAILASLPLRMDVDAWGSKANLGAAYLAAHLATVGRRGGTGGAVTGESVGSVSRQYAAPLAGNALAASAYGLEYEALLLSIPVFRATTA